MSAESPSARAGGSAGGAAPATTPDAVMLAAFNAAFDAAMHGDCDLDEANLAGIRAALAARPAAAPATTPDATDPSTDPAAVLAALERTERAFNAADMEDGPELDLEDLCTLLRFTRAALAASGPGAAQTDDEDDDPELTRSAYAHGEGVGYEAGGREAIGAAIELVRTSSAAGGWIVSPSAFSAALEALRGPGAAATPTDGEATWGKYVSHNDLVDTLLLLYRSGPNTGYSEDRLWLPEQRVAVVAMLNLLAQLHPAAVADLRAADRGPTAIPLPLRPTPSGPRPASEEAPDATA